MSSKFPMMSLDKVEVRLTVKNESVVGVDKVAKMAGMSRASVINGYIDDGLMRAKVVLDADDMRAKVVLDADDIKRVEEMRAADMAVAVALLAATLAAMAWIHRTASRIERECRIHEERRMAERAVNCAAGALLVLGSHPTTPEGRARLAVIARKVAADAKALAAAKGGEA